MTIHDAYDCEIKRLGVSTKLLSNSILLAEASFDKPDDGFCELMAEQVLAECNDYCDQHGFIMSMVADDEETQGAGGTAVICPTCGIGDVISSSRRRGTVIARFGFDNRSTDN